MKNMRSIIITIMCMSLIGCTSLGLKPTPTNSPTSTSTATATPTSTSTPTVTPLPTATSTPAEFGTNGLPIFPESSTSQGNGLEIAFSQGILNRLEVKSILIPEDNMQDLKNALIGGWIYLMGGEGFESADPMKLDSLATALQKTPGINVIFNDQKIYLGPKTLLRFEYVLLCSEHTILIDYYSKQPSSAFRVRPGFTPSPIMFLHMDNDKLTFTYSISCEELDYVKNHNTGIELKIASTLFLSFLATYGPLYDFCADVQHFTRCWSSRRAGKQDAIITTNIVSFHGSKEEIESTVLGGCTWEGKNGCLSGSEFWRFTVAR